MHPCHLRYVISVDAILILPEWHCFFCCFFLWKKVAFYDKKYINCILSNIKALSKREKKTLPPQSINHYLLLAKRNCVKLKHQFVSTCLTNVFVYVSYLEPLWIFTCPYCWYRKFWLSSFLFYGKFSMKKKQQHKFSRW